MKAVGIFIVVAIVFVGFGWALGSRAVPQKAPAAAAEPQPAAAGGDMGGIGATHGGVAKPADVGDVKVSKAEGPDARTVAEVVAQSAELKDKTVVVRGKVVRFTREVMGKNWAHIQDGSGSAAENTHDILVTTQDQAKIGDVVVAKGVVQTNVELGSGYNYKVLIGDATLK